MGERTVSRDAVAYDRFQPASHLAGVIALCETLGWPSYADPVAACAAFSAPGAITWVALVSGDVVGLVHMLSNGAVHAHLSLIGVHPDYRRSGIARHLVTTAFRGAGAKWLDLWAEPGSESFYRSFVHQQTTGFRIYPTEQGREPL